MASQSTSRSIPRLIELVRPAIRPRGYFKRELMENFCIKHKLLSIATAGSRNVGYIGGEKSYVLLGSLAKLERALMMWTMDKLVSEHNFMPVVAPNILHDRIIEKCGFPTKSERSQVYKISANNDDSILDENSARAKSENRNHSCLAATSEFALASIHIGDSISAEELPKRYCALSRCYRAETSSSASEWGLYRVHYFNKVEMVALTMPDKSGSMQEEFLKIQRAIFDQLNLHYQVLDMPHEDLGLSAKRKYDVEAWMEGRQRFGEISSTSDCGDYQSSRLDIRYSKMVERDNQLQVDSGHVHTVNGTACSSIRTMIALVEQHQTEDGRVELPDALVPYMGGAKTIPTPEDAKLLLDVELHPTNED